MPSGPGEASRLPNERSGHLKPDNGDFLKGDVVIACECLGGDGLAEESDDRGTPRSDANRPEDQGQGDDEAQELGQRRGEHGRRARPGDLRRDQEAGDPPCHPEEQDQGEGARTRSGHVDQGDDIRRMQGCCGAGLARWGWEPSERC